MKKTPTGTAVGVDDPYAHAGVCDHVMGDGTCRYAFEHPEHDRAFAAERASEDYRCPAAAGDCEWRDCPHYRSTSDARECARCGLEERRDAHTDARPLLEEHHLAYADERSESAEHVSGEGRPASERDGPAGDADDGVSHEITVTLCRWCHAAVHDSWARIDDDASPSAEALAEAEGRRSAELDELGFETAATRAERSEDREKSER
ncbi:hypothetical protein J2752_002056 [Halarchaeum rubridurum]|uniref:Uncharacterized protein n=1 Tax=Halarchaeum rubridurum TaxID=489911 RepID=A0A830G002_9EURY|nr:hypothetical protein [Halarchaeum rubridurum]MBP1955144.1 hypothetical protein [Halarchaeum rubridurum]GGM68575.1 hypothetical protein GCM10009017_18510 [Halarchaeum rubridurum]